MSVLVNPQTPRLSTLFWWVAAVVLLGNAVLVTSWPRLTGTAASEWALGFDLLVLLPLLYLWTHRHRGRQAWFGAAALFGFGVLAGSWLLPAGSKQFWLLLETLRLPVLLIVVGVQLLLIATVIRAAWRQADARPLEDSIAAALQQRLGAQPTTRLLLIEARLWIYALLRRPLRAPFPGTRHFSVHRQGENASNQLAFLIIVAAEIPLAHALLHFIWSPLAALVITTLSLYGLVFLWAEYRATCLRPISLEDHHLHIRHGLLGDVVVPLSAIAAVERCQGAVRRVSGRLRFTGMGAANLRLVLAPGMRLQTPFRLTEVAEIYLGVDDPAGLQAALTASVTAQP